MKKTGGTAIGVLNAHERTCDCNKATRTGETVHETDKKGMIGRSGPQVAFGKDVSSTKTKEIAAKVLLDYAARPA